MIHLLRYLMFGRGDIPPVTREIIRAAEPDPALRLRAEQDQRSLMAPPFSEIWCQERGVGEA